MAATLSSVILHPPSLFQLSNDKSHQFFFLKPNPFRHFHKHSHPSPSSLPSFTNHTSNRSISKDAAESDPRRLDFSQQVAALQRLYSDERLEEASKLLIEIEKRHHPLRPDIFTYNNLLRSYIKLGRLDEAHHLFDRMPERNAISWSSMISANTRCGNFLIAFDLFGEMMEEGSSPNEFALGSLIKASACLMDVFTGRQLHGWSIRTGFASDAGVRTSIITMYSNCGFLDDARRVFDEVSISSQCDTPTWNSMISAYISYRRWSESFRLFEVMLWTGVASPTEPTYASMINACGSVGALEYGKIIHGKIIKDELPNMTRIENSLVTFYSKCGNLEDANRMFEAISWKNVVSWNAIVSGHEQNGDKEDAINLFRRLLEPESNVKPNRITFLSVLSAISAVSDLKHSGEAHAYVTRLGLDHDTSIGNSLITMYAKCGELQKARLVFEKLLHRDIVSWNSMLAGYSQNEEFGNCFELFMKMQVLGIEPDDHSITIILGALSSNPSASTCKRGREIHGYLLRRDATDAVGVSTYNAILTMYAKCNRLMDAKRIFEGMHERDSYSWNAMMDGFSINGDYDNAVLIFLEMLEEGVQSDHLGLSILLTACGRLASLQLGRQFHAFIIKRHYQNRNYQSSLLSINNALVSMYSKCGTISDATSVFVRMARRDVFSWTAIITGYAHHGMGYESLRLFNSMKADGIKPNSISFLGLLTACAHAGLVEEGTCHFRSMIKDHGLMPSVEHYACMVDLFGRLGQFERAKEMVEAGISHLKLEQGACLNLWRVLLGACHAHKHLKLGVQAAMKILEAEPEDETTYILLSNLYAAFGMWRDSVRVRRLMRDRGLKKQEVGCSWIEEGNQRHVFVAGDVSHPHRKEIYEKLEELDAECRGLGYVPMTEYVLHDVDEFQKEAIIACHSEKLAVSFSLLQSEPTKGVIRVVKNLRVCGDCHNWMKFISQIAGREIVLRDLRRFHFFEGGRCSCGDYW
ncbi:Pentatricopeptide repeat [Cinnamomum micranthum f. kanehirae]|uniref:Pentatricopeptide repeat n=1 Tax=Cinnamomum micranthum f. kanehirae TaxID=337451 RepID=A0A3S3Q3L0_9MAGN|nr:Pentatricopeptide repeat [Cinnamomum micranthum f. kanehirae]